MTPKQVMKQQTWDKAYWNYTKEDWQDWINAFSHLPLKEYNGHIGSCIDLYLDDESTIKDILAGSR